MGHTVGAIGSCLAGLTAAMLAGDYRWTRLNNATVDRSDVFLKYVIQQSRMPSRSFVEMLLPLKPEYAAQSRLLFDRMFRETIGRVELPPETKPLCENLEHGRFDVLLLDNLFDTFNIKASYRSFSGQQDFEFNFPVHWSDRSESTDASLHYAPRLEPAESARNWADIARHLRQVQPTAHIVFLCTPSSTFVDDPDRAARADAFEPAFRAALGDTDIEVVSQLHIPRALSKLPDDTDHFDMAVYRALAGRVLSSFLIRQRAFRSQPVAGDTDS